MQVSVMLGCSVAYFFTFLGSWVPSILQLTYKSIYLFSRGLLKSLVCRLAGCVPFNEREMEAQAAVPVVSERSSCLAFHVLDQGGCGGS